MSDSIKITSLNAVTATGAGGVLFTGRDRNLHAMQVILGDLADATDVQVDIEGSLDGGTTYGTVASWKKSDGRASGEIVVASFVPLDHIRANCKEITGGTAGRTSVTAIILSSDS